jgi:hypothetical protein
MVLLCNAPEAAPQLLAGLDGTLKLNQRRAETMRGAHRAPGLEALRASSRFGLAKAALDRFVASFA